MQLSPYPGAQCISLGTELRTAPVKIRAASSCGIRHDSRGRAPPYRSSGGAVSNISSDKGSAYKSTCSGAGTTCVNIQPTSKV